MEIIGIITLIINTIILGINVWIIRKSPVDAIKIGRELNEEKQKDDAKRELFLQLFESRGHPISYPFVRNLNRIDVVYSDCPEVLHAWHAYFHSLKTSSNVDNQKDWELHRTSLLSQMARSLGYNELDNFQLMQHYLPEGHQRHDIDNYEMWVEQKNYYHNSNHLILKLLSNLSEEDDNKE